MSTAPARRMNAADPFELERFVRAQADDHATALAELRAGRKRSHWIWYVLPQLRGLGFSAMSQRYGLGGADEARAYLAHPLLGPRLLECIAALDAHAGTPPQAMLGEVDALKLRSCLTLFAHVAPPGSPFEVALQRHFGGQRDAATLRLLAQDAR